jgi:hypothetical protein
VLTVGCLEKKGKMRGGCGGLVHLASMTRMSWGALGRRRERGVRAATERLLAGPGLETYEQSELGKMSKIRERGRGMAEMVWLRRVAKLHGVDDYESAATGARL